MLDQLAAAYGELEDNPDVRCGVLHAHGEMFTAGLDLANVAPKVTESGILSYAEASIDPLNFTANVHGQSRLSPPFRANV